MARGRGGGEATRERILTASLPLFADHGFAGTSTRMVAKAAGVNVATLAYYFEGKEGLYLAVVERLYEALSRLAPTELPNDVGDPLDWAADVAWTFCKSHREHIRLLLRHVLDRGHHPEATIVKWTSPLAGRIEGLFKAFRPDWSSAQMRLFLLGAMHMVVRFTIEDAEHLSVLVGHPDDLDAEVVKFIRELLRLQLGVPVTG